MKALFSGSLLLLCLAGCVMIPPQVQHDPLTPVVQDAQVSLPQPNTIETVEPLPMPVRTLSEDARAQLLSSEVTCVATAMIAEAGGEGRLGMIAVGYVIMNRMGTHARNTRKFRATACGVVYQRDRTRSGRIGCQFSWVCHPTGKDPKRHPNYKKALALASAVINGTVDNPINDSIFFNVRRLRPAHTRGLPLRAQIGNHNFFAAK